MDPGFFCWSAAVSIAAAGVTLVVVASLGGGSTTGVARSLEMIEKSVILKDVGRSELSAGDRLIVPFFGRDEALALRLSPSGTGDRLTPVTRPGRKPARPVA